MQFACFLLIVPIVIFIIGWFKPLWMIIALCAILILSCMILKNICADDYRVTISKKGLLVIFVSAFLFTYAAGAGGGFPQANDMWARNAIYRDLILKPWPVFYEGSNRALDYYIGYWMLPSLACKIFLPFMTEYNVWIIARVVMFLYEFAFITVIELVLQAVVSRKYSCQDMPTSITVKTCLIFCFWGTLLFIGVFFSGVLKSSLVDALNSPALFQTLKAVWDGKLPIEHCISKIGVENCNLIQAGNVFNQALPAWLATLLFLYDEKAVKFYGVFALSLAISAPLPMIGLIAMMFVKFIILLIRKECKIWDVFCAENMLSLVLVFIPFLYYRGNGCSSLAFHNIFDSASILQSVMQLILFCLLSFGIYGLLCRERTSPFFIAVEILNLCFVFVYINDTSKLLGYTGDFTMRATIPFLTYFMVCMIGLLISSEYKLRYRKMCGTIAILIAGLIPVFYIIDACNRSIAAHTTMIEYDFLYTLDGTSASSLGVDTVNYYIDQYTNLNPSKDFFFTFFCRDNYWIEEPVIEYKKTSEGNTYVAAVSLTGDMVDKVMDNVIASDENTIEYIRNELNKTGSEKITVLRFDSGELRPLSESTLSELSNDDVGIVWRNYNKTYSKNRGTITAAVDLTYYGKEPIRYCDMANVPDLESGIAIELLDKDSNIIAYPWTGCYTGHVVYPNDTEQYIMQIPIPTEKGEYQFCFCLFYTDADGEHRLVRTTPYPFEVK